ncbi:hypothetical protein [Polaromonas sp. CG9_12]|nr:hypothetical protein [Polaromonas sp. CG9_12]
MPVRRPEPDGLVMIFLHSANGIQTCALLLDLLLAAARAAST